MADVISHSLFTDFDIDLFKSGKHFKLYEKFGAHALDLDGMSGTYFAVFAPAAKAVSVIGNFNAWDGSQHALQVRWDSSGIWEGFIPNVRLGELYKYRIWSENTDHPQDKADPFAFFAEVAPKTSSISWSLDYNWQDNDWMGDRKRKQSLDRAFSIYELHLGSWKRQLPGNEPLSYQALAKDLVAYISEMGYTHVELMPITEYPYEMSWGYQVTGYFAPTSRYGNPQECMYLIDCLHQQDIGVILDWVPAHFPGDGHGLYRFDGSCVYEHPDIRKGYHPDWKSYIFNYERPEVRSFLISSAFFWLDKYHIDGLRVDAVSSMIYLDYSREEGEWEPNQFGGNEYLAAIDFLKELNASAYSNFDGIQMIAEESTAFPGVSHPIDSGGLGFGMKWMMGWMHDTLNYFGKEPAWRKHHQDAISFSLVYAFTENFVLPLSHDEVVHGKGSITGRMPGDEWQRFANLRTLYTYMFMHPGAKLNFMGNEFGQYKEWNVTQSLDWHLLQYDPHLGLQKLVQALNHTYKNEPALYELQFDQDGFEWIAHDDAENSVIAFIRKGKEPKTQIIVIANFTPVPRDSYAVGVNDLGDWQLILNSDASDYYGSDFQINSTVTSTREVMHGKQFSIRIALPPLSCICYKLDA